MKRTSLVMGDADQAGSNDGRHVDSKAVVVIAGEFFEKWGFP